MDCIPGCNNATPRAGPIKGAVQGEATITANVPVKNDDNKLLWFFPKTPNLVRLLPRTRLPMKTIPTITKR